MGYLHLAAGCCGVSSLLHSNYAMVCNLCFFVWCQLQIEILCIIQAIFDHKMASEAIPVLLAYFVWYHNVTVRKWGLPKLVDRGPLGSFRCYYAAKWLATVLWPTLSTVRPWKAATKVVRPKSYWGLRCTCICRQGLKQKGWQSSTNFCYHIIVHNYIPKFWFM